MLRIEHWIGKKRIRIQILPRCEWCGSDFRGHEIGCPDLED
jgi:hypothetical protein